MIKEYIENLPGGKEYILAQRGLGIIIGAIPIFIMVLFVAITTYGDIGVGYSKDGVIAIMLFLSGSWMILISVIGLIVYYYRINKADNMYMSKMTESKKG